ncbi:hypothetical protein [Pseudomonas marginalis]|nr:hypothetical protein [Pseudomonas marginalis]
MTAPITVQTTSATTGWPSNKARRTQKQELRHTAPYGTRQMLDALMRWHEIEEVSEAVQLLVLNGRAEDLPPAPPKVKGPSEIIRHYFRQGMRDRLAALTAELGETKDRTTIWRLIAQAHSLGAENSASMLEIKRHEIDIPQNVARKLRQAGLAESIQMNAEDDADK